MERALQVLVISTDDSLEAEIAAALGEVRGVNAIVRAEADPRRGSEVARDRRPDLVVLGMEAGGELVRQTAEEVAAGSPESMLVAAYRLDELGAEGPADSVIGVLRASVRDFLRRPVSSAEMSDVLRRLVLDRPAERRGPVGRIASFVSNKGGVGKSTVALSTACQLAHRQPERVLLVDASIQLGVCASMLDLEPDTTLADAARQVDRLDESLLTNLSLPHESGLRLLAAPRDAVEAADVDERALTRVLTVARRAFDIVIVDTFPLIDAVAIAILDLSDRVHVVVNGMVPNVVGIASYLSVLDQVGVARDRQRLVLNATHPPFGGQLSPVDIADRLGRTLDHVVPYSKSVLAAMNQGSPAILSAPRWSRFARAIREVAADSVSTGPRTGRAVAPSDAADGPARDGDLPLPEAST